MHRKDLYSRSILVTETESSSWEILEYKFVSQILAGSSHIFAGYFQVKGKEACELLGISLPVRIRHELPKVMELCNRNNIYAFHSSPKLRLEFCHLSFCRTQKLAERSSVLQTRVISCGLYSLENSLQLHRCNDSHVAEEYRMSSVLCSEPLLVEFL